MIKDVIQQVIAGGDIGAREMEAVVGDIIDGKTTPGQVGAFMTAMRMKTATVDEIVGAVRALRARVRPLSLGLRMLNMDRDDINFEAETIAAVSDADVRGSRIFNVSAATAFVAAAGGVRIARFGNRLMSGFLGTADVLENLGINLDLSHSDVERCIRENGVGFMFASAFHSTMRHVVKLRREVGIRSIFNFIGPLANPADAACHALGVYYESATEKFARAIRRLGGERALVFHGDATVDELSICGPSRLSFLHDGRIEDLRIEPETYGFARVEPAALHGGTIRENAAIVRGVLAGEKGPRRDLVVLNAAALFWAAGAVDDLRQGIERAADILDRGLAADRLAAVAAFTRRCGAFSLDDISPAMD